MRSMLISLVFILVFGGCAYFEKQRIAQLELDLAEYSANMRESQNALQYAYGEYPDFIEELDDIYDEAYAIAKEAKEMLLARKAQLAK